MLYCSLLHFSFSQSSSQGSKTTFLNELFKSFASILTNSFTLSLNFSLFLFLLISILCIVFCFIFMWLNRFSFFTSTTTNLCCSSPGITLTSFKTFCFLFELKHNQSQFHYHLNRKRALSHLPFLLLKSCICHTEILLIAEFQ